MLEKPGKATLSVDGAGQARETEEVAATRAGSASQSHDEMVKDREELCLRVKALEEARSTELQEALEEQ